MPAFYPFDVRLRLHDIGSTPVTANGNGTVVAAAVNFDTESTDARWEAMTVINVATGTFASHTYTLVIEGSNSATFASGNFQLGSILVDRVGQYQVPFVNEQAGVVYRYVRIRHVVTGGTPSLVYSSFMAPVRGF